MSCLYQRILTLFVSLTLVNLASASQPTLKQETVFKKDRTVFQVLPTENGYLVYSNYFWTSDGQAEVTQITNQGQIDSSFIWKGDYDSKWLRKIVPTSDKGYLAVIHGYREEWFRIQKFFPDGSLDTKFQLSNENLSSTIEQVSMVGINEGQNYYILHIRYAEKNSNQRINSQLCINKLNGQIISRCGQSKKSEPLNEAIYTSLSNDEAVIFHRLNNNSTNIMLFKGVSPESSFGTKGVINLPLDIQLIKGLNRGPNKNIYILADRNLISLKANGTLDVTFGKNGFLDLNSLNTRSCDSQMCNIQQNQFYINSLGEIIISGFIKRNDQHFLVFKKLNLNGQEILINGQNQLEIQYNEDLSRVDIDLLAPSPNGKIHLLTSTWKSMIFWEMDAF